MNRQIDHFMLRDQINDLMIAIENPLRYGIVQNNTVGDDRDRKLSVLDMTNLMLA